MSVYCCYTYSAWASFGGGRGGGGEDMSPTFGSEGGQNIWSPPPPPHFLGWTNPPCISIFICVLRSFLLDLSGSHVLTESRTKRPEDKTPCECENPYGQNPCGHNPQNDIWDITPWISVVVLKRMFYMWMVNFNVIYFNYNYIRQNIPWAPPPPPPPRSDNGDMLSPCSQLCSIYVEVSMTGPNPSNQHSKVSNTVLDRSK